MNPDPIILDALARRDASDRRIRQEQQAQLHRAAVERRRKAKRGDRDSYDPPWVRERKREDARRA